MFHEGPHPARCSLLAEVTPPVRASRRARGRAGRVWCVSHPTTGTLGYTGSSQSRGRAPWVLPKPERPYPHEHETLHSTTMGWRMVNPRMPTDADADGRGCRRSGRTPSAGAPRCSPHAAAWNGGLSDQEVITADGAELARDETIRPDTDAARLAASRPAFRP